MERLEAYTSDYRYKLLSRFHYPFDDGETVHAVAFRTVDQKFLVSAYTILSGMIVVHVWAILIALGAYIWLRKGKNNVSDLSMSLWNKRGATEGSLLDTIMYAKRHDLSRLRFYPILLAIAIAWAAGIAAGIMVPSMLVLGNAAPVNPEDVVVPYNYPTAEQKYSIPGQHFTIYDLHVMRASRAASSALALDSEAKRNVVFAFSNDIEPPQKAGERSQSFTYHYNFSGADLGLQHVPGLLLNVTGHCITDYSTWSESDSSCDPTCSDIYNIKRWGRDVQSEASMGSASSAPMAFFYLSEDPVTLVPGNLTWSVMVSSVDREVFGGSNDPWYKTNAPRKGSQPTVLPGRPTLSCWEDDEWSYGDRKGGITELAAITNGELPPLLIEILTHYLGVPAILSIGPYLGTGNLKSASFSNSGTTLYPALSTVDKDGEVFNMARSNDTNEPLISSRDFVIYTPEVVALSIPVLVIVPALAAGTWLIMIALLYLSPLRMASAMEVIELFQDLIDRYGPATVKEIEVEEKGKMKTKHTIVFENLEQEMKHKKSDEQEPDAKRQTETV
ncbi:hypothetical protein OQA88_10642 [Cercophora sp. LCS_1]